MLGPLHEAPENRIPEDGSTQPIPDPGSTPTKAEGGSPYRLLRRSQLTCQTSNAPSLDFHFLHQLSETEGRNGEEETPQPTRPGPGPLPHLYFQEYFGVSYSSPERRKRQDPNQGPLLQTHQLIHRSGYRPRINETRAITSPPFLNGSLRRQEETRRKVFLSSTHLLSTFTHSPPSRSDILQPRTSIDPIVSLPILNKLNSLLSGKVILYPPQIYRILNTKPGIPYQVKVSTLQNPITLSEIYISLIPKF